MCIQAGAASIIITPPLETQIQGAGLSDQPAKIIRDELEANAVYFSSAEETVLLISCDLMALPTDFVITTRTTISQAIGIPQSNVILSATHTHGGPSIIKTDYVKPVEKDFLATLSDQLVTVAQQAKQAAQPVQISWGLGEAQIGYNRRCCWADGSHSMHNPEQKPDFTGEEGPVDPAHLAVFVCDMQDKPLAVIHHNTTHPVSFYATNTISSDFPGDARGYIRDVMGKIPVLFLNGAQGDIAPSESLPQAPHEHKEQIIKRNAHLLAGETLKLFHTSRFQDNVILGHRYADLTVGVRLPAPDRLAWAQDVICQIKEGKEICGMDRLNAWGITSLQDEFEKNPTEVLRLHVIRLGDIALVTQPCELYCQFGLDIKRRSPAPITGVCSITEGYGGYCPTLYSILGGGYSGEPIAWCRLAPETGYQLVDEASRLLHQLWKNK